MLTFKFSKDTRTRDVIITILEEETIMMFICIPQTVDLQVLRDRTYAQLAALANYDSVPSANGTEH